MTRQETFYGLYNAVMYWLDNVNSVKYVRENPKMTLRKCYSLLLDATTWYAMPVKGKETELLYKTIVKQLKPVEDAETVENPRLLYNHILKVMQKAEELRLAEPEE